MTRVITCALFAAAILSCVQPAMAGRFFRRRPQQKQTNNTTTVRADPWVGQRVMLRHNARPRLGNRTITSWQVMSTVVSTQHSELWLGWAWVDASEVVLLDNAEAYYTNLLNLHTCDIRAWSYQQRGRLKAFNGDHKGAFADFSLAVKLKPDDAWSYIQRGRGWMALKEHDMALADFDHAIKLDKANSHAYVDRANCRVKTSHYKMAVRDYQTALQISPDSTNILNDLAWILATCPDAGVRDGRTAVKYATQACQLNEMQNAAYLDTLAAAHAEADDFPAAVRWQAKAVKVAQADKALKNDKHGYAERLALFQKGRPYRLLTTTRQDKVKSETTIAELPSIPSIPRLPALATSLEDAKQVAEAPTP